VISGLIPIKCLDRGVQLAQNLDETLFLKSASEFCAAALLSEDHVADSGTIQKFDDIEAYQSVYIMSNIVVI